MQALTKLKGLFLRETLRFLKVPYQTIGNTAVSSSLYLLIFGVSMGRSISLESHISYLAFLIPGLVALGIVRNAFENASSSIIAAKYMNELQDFRIAPLPPAIIAAAISLASLVRGVIVACITYLVGALFFAAEHGELLSVAHPLELIYFITLGGLTFGSLGLVIAMYASSFEMINALSSFILVPLIYLGGVFFNLDSLSPFWAKISSLNPLYYLIDGIRYAFLGVTDVSIPFSMLLLMASFATFFLLSLLSLRKGSHFARF